MATKTKKKKKWADSHDYFVPVTWMDAEEKKTGEHMLLF